MRYRAIDEMGNVYGALTVIAREENTVHRAAQWLCRCVCGNTVVVSGGVLRNGGKRSCGCLPRKENLVDQVFGKLTVVRQATDEETSHKQWLCLCTCGRTRLVAGNALRAGRAGSCGICPRSEDISGRVFGKLTVVRRSGNKDLWVCQCCVCGSTRIVYGKQLKNGSIRNCGYGGLCHASDVAAFGSVYRSYVWNAKRRGIGFVLTKNQVRELTKMSCYYCGGNPQTVSEHDRSKYVYNGIDRVDNDKGYTIDNCVPCCAQCNKMKGRQTAAEFLALVGKIHEFQHTP